jgi:hypothetical protein
MLEVSGPPPCRPPSAPTGRSQRAVDRPSSDRTRGSINRCRRYAQRPRCASRCRAQLRPASPTPDACVRSLPPRAPRAQASTTHGPGSAPRPPPAASISAPEYPSVCTTGRCKGATSKPTRWRPRWIGKMPSRVPGVGKSTKEISSKRPFRISSCGRLSMSFAVATRKTLDRRSCIHVSSVPSMRLPAPVSPSPEPPARPFRSRPSRARKAASHRPPSAPCTACVRFRPGTCRTARRSPCETAALARTPQWPWPRCSGPLRPKTSSSATPSGACLTDSTRARLAAVTCPSPSVRRARWRTDDSGIATMWRSREVSAARAPATSWPERPRWRCGSSLKSVFTRSSVIGSS